MFRSRLHRWISAVGTSLSVCSLLGTVLFCPVVAESAELGLVEKKPTAGRFVKTPHGYMVSYLQQIPGTEQSFQMVPIPGGSFQMGSPGAEAGREPDEGPQVKVTISPFWMSRHEVTWGEYQAFMALYAQLSRFRGYAMV